jgi:hypothetical protein
MLGNNISGDILPPYSLIHEDGVSMFHRNIGTNPSDHTVVSQMAKISIFNIIKGKGIVVNYAKYFSEKYGGILNLSTK